MQLWQEIADLPVERIQRRGMADNYWSMGIPGPCGPSSEIYYDRGPEFGIDGGPEANEDRYIEIWNLVFMQNERGEGTSKDDFEILGPLPRKNIDTGMGVERVAFLLQGVANVYETDLLRPAIDAVARRAPRGYDVGNHADDVRYRIIADHSRTAAILIGDGVSPGNDGRGYVLRRLLRRVIRSAKLLDIDGPIVGELMATVRDAMGPSYPELVADFDRINRIAVAEETAFNRTLQSGSRLFEEVAGATKSSGATVLSGSDAFTLHDTYGFPIELTLEMAAEADLQVDELGFRELMAEQRRRAKADAAARKHAHADLTAYRELVDAGPTEFTGFDELTSQARILGIFVDGKRVPVVAHGAEGSPRVPTASNWCWTARRCTPSRVGRSPTPAASVAPAPARPPRPPSPTCRRSPKPCGCTASTWSPESSSKATPWSRPWILAGARAPPRGTPAPTWCTPRCDKCWGPTPFRPGR